MDVGLALVFVVVFLISFMFLMKPKNLPPGPLSLPYVGWIGLIWKIKKKRPHFVLNDIGKQYGTVSSFKLGNRLVVLLNGYDAIREALVKQSDVFSDRPTYMPALKAFVSEGGGVLFNNYNHDWKMLRRFTLQALRDFGVGKSSLEEKIEEEVVATTKWFKKNADKPVDINACMQKLVGNILFGIVFGKRYDYEDPEFEEIRLMTNTAISGDGPLSATNFLPKFIVRILKTFSKQRELEDIKKIADDMRSFIHRRVDEHESTFDENNIRDFIDLHIKTTRDHEGEERSEFSKGNLFRVINDLFLAGTETTSTTLDWAFLYMAEFPDVQKKCQAEIEEVVGDKYIQYSDRENLPYLNAILMEIQRLTIIVPLSVIHNAIRDTTLYGYNIPRDTLIIPNLYSTTRDPKYWTDPEKFNPDRFIDKSGKLLKPDALIPFSTGPRQCLGEPLARMELFLVFANLVQRFNFRRENEAVKHPLESRPFNITNVALPYKLWIKSRN